LPSEQVMPSNEQRVLVVDANDTRTILGMGWVTKLSDWPDNKIVHSTDPSLPLNSREPRFLTVLGTSMVPTIKDLAIIEVIVARHFDRNRVPPLWRRGHRIDLTYHVGTGSQARVEIPSVWEVQLDGRTIGSLSGELSLEQLGDEALKFAEQQVQACVLERESQF
jgi:hypothetical protein